MQQSAANGELSTQNKSAYSARLAIAIEMPLGRDGGDLGAEVPTKFGGDRSSGWRAMGVRVSECRECAGSVQEPKWVYAESKGLDPEGMPFRASEVQGQCRDRGNRPKLEGDVPEKE